jgi:DNA-binding IclR family transcriptional regulator
MPTIELAEERLVIIKLFLELERSVQESYFPNMLLADALELINVGLLIYEAQQGGRLPTVSDLSKKLGLSRASIRRRLAQLVALGYVERQMNRYMMGPAFGVPPGGRATVQRHIAMVHAAARKLANLAANRK